MDCVIDSSANPNEITTSNTDGDIINEDDGDKKVEEPREYDRILESLNRTPRERSKELCDIIKIPYDSIKKDKDIKSIRDNMKIDKSDVKNLEEDIHHNQPKNEQDIFGGEEDSQKIVVKKNNRNTKKNKGNVKKSTVIHKKNKGSIQKNHGRINGIPEKKRENSKAKKNLCADVSIM